MAIAALITWIITAGFGFFMLSKWIAAGGLRRQAGTASHFQPPVVFGHFLLAASGLVVWIIYVVNDNETLAWVAFIDLLLVAGIGDLLVYRWFKDRGALAADTDLSGAGAVGDQTATTTRTGLAEQTIPIAVVVIHGIFAVTTVILVLLAALEVGGS